MDMKHILQVLDKASSRQVKGADDMHRFVSVVKSSNTDVKEASGYIPKNKKEAKDPRYSTALTVDVQPGAVEKNLKALSLAEGRKTFVDYLNEAAKKCNHTVEGKQCPVHGLEECSMYEEDLDEVAGAKKCWPRHRKVGTQPGTGKNAGKSVNDCEKIKEEDEEVDESGLQYYTGVKKHGKEYMKKAAAAGREGASQKEIGALKDKYSKAHKEESVEQGVAEGVSDKFSVYDKVEEVVEKYQLFDKRGWTDLFAKLAGRKLDREEIYQEMEYASKFLQLLDSIRMRSDYRGQQDPKKDQELIDLSNQWIDLFKQATSEFKAMSSQGVAEESKGLYYNVNKRKKAGTSRDASSPKAPSAQAWKDAAKTAKK